MCILRQSIEWRGVKEKHFRDQRMLSTCKSWRKPQNNCLIVHIQILRYIPVIWFEWIESFQFSGESCRAKIAVLIWNIFYSSLKSHHLPACPLHTVKKQKLKMFVTGAVEGIFTSRQKSETLTLSFLLLIVTLCGWNQEYTFRIMSVKS